MDKFHIVTSTPDEQPIPTMLTINEVAKRTNLSYNFVYKLCKNNEIIYVKAGCKYLINFEKFLEFLNTGNN